MALDAQGSLGASWGVLGFIFGLLSLLGVLGPLGAHFGLPEAHFEALGASWASWGLLGLIFGLLRLILGLLGAVSRKSLKRA